MESSLPWDEYTSSSALPYTRNDCAHILVQLYESGYGVRGYVAVARTRQRKERP